jgi:hypothetical protein
LYFCRYFLLEYSREGKKEIKNDVISILQLQNFAIMFASYFI